MKIYTLNRYSPKIDVFECKRETPKLYRCLTPRGSPKDIRKSEAFLTWREAHAALERRARASLEVQKRRLDMERSNLEKVRTMMEPE